MRFLLIAGLAESLIIFRGPLIRALQAKGLTVHVAAPDMPAGSEVRLQLEAMGVTVHEVPLQRANTNPMADIALLWALWRLMRHVKPECVLGYTIKPVVYGSLAAWLARVPRRFALITGLGYAFQGQGQRGRLQALVTWLYGAALKRDDKVFFQNPDDEALFRQKGILTSGTPSFVINGSGVDVASYSVAPLPLGPPRFLLIARLLGDKGVREYAQAARILRMHRPDVKFTIVGWIDDNPDSIGREELDAWVADGTLDFLGRLSDVRPAIVDCSVYVLPSYREGTPRTVLEAMSMGRPVITTDAPGCRETVVEDENGFLVPARSVDALILAMERFILEPELIKRMGMRSREMAVAKFDVHKVNAVMLREMGIR